MDEKEPQVAPILVEIAVAVIAFLIILTLIGVYLEAVWTWYGAVLGFLYGLWGRIRISVAVVVTLLNIGMIGFIFVVLGRFFPLKRQMPVFIVPGEGKPFVPSVPIEKTVDDEWQEIRKLIDSENPSEWNMAVLRTDSLLDIVLQRLGHEGTTTKERLDRADPTLLPSLDRLYSAHRLRNMIAHEPLEQHTKETIIQALRSYQQGLKE